jgi:hypothetical protein
MVAAQRKHGGREAQGPGVSVSVVGDVVVALDLAKVIRAAGEQEAFEVWWEVGVVAAAGGGGGRGEGCVDAAHCGWVVLVGWMDGILVVVGNWGVMKSESASELLGGIEIGCGDQWGGYGGLVGLVVVRLSSTILRSFPAEKNTENSVNPRFKTRKKTSLERSETRVY